MPRYDDRQTAAQRGYGYKWQKARDAFLKKHPFCFEHAKRGKTVVATVVDHIVPHRNDMKLFWDKSNWQSLCKPCHDSHKQRLEKSGRVIGCDESGMPIDPGHHWNQSEG
ncbi:MAG: HNH endonuclease [Candidatus Thiodiazotropha sp. (ex Ctena orbiculata)]|nr:HNH endonuclease [Candidatus Thiodiazotropha taylori]